MFYTLVTCLAAALLGQASAGYASGKCPNITSLPYRAEFANRIQHRVLYADDTTYNYINLLQKATANSKSINMTCLKDGTYGYNATRYAYWYQNSTGTLAMNFLFYDAPTGTQLLYYCVDQMKMRDLLSYLASKYGLALPAAVINSVSKLLTRGHFDIFVVTSAQKSISTTV